MSARDLKSKDKRKTGGGVQRRSAIRSDKRTSYKRVSIEVKSDTFTHVASGHHLADKLHERSPEFDSIKEKFELVPGSFKEHASTSQTTSPPTSNQVSLRVDSIETSQSIDNSAASSLGARPKHAKPPISPKPNKKLLASTPEPKVTSQASTLDVPTVASLSLSGDGGKSVSRESTFSSSDSGFASQRASGEVFFSAHSSIRSVASSHGGSLRGSSDVIGGVKGTNDAATSDAQQQQDVATHVAETLFNTVLTLERCDSIEDLPLSEQITEDANETELAAIFNQSPHNTTTSLADNESASSAFNFSENNCANKVQLRVCGDSPSVLGYSAPNPHTTVADDSTSPVAAASGSVPSCSSLAAAAAATAETATAEDIVDDRIYENADNVAAKSYMHTHVKSGLFRVFDTGGAAAMRKKSSQNVADDPTTHPATSASAGLNPQSSLDMAPISEGADDDTTTCDQAGGRLTERKSSLYENVWIHPGKRIKKRHSKGE